MEHHAFHNTGEHGKEKFLKEVTKLALQKKITPHEAKQIIDIGEGEGWDLSFLNVYHDLPPAFEPEPDAKLTAEEAEEIARRNGMLPPIDNNGQRAFRQTHATRP